MVKNPIHNPITLNNADGWDKKQVATINAIVMSEKNRWVKKTQQQEIIPSKKKGITDEASFVSSSLSYKYNGFLSTHFYIRSDAMKECDSYKLFKFSGKILSYRIQGNCYKDYYTEGDFNKFFYVEVNEDELRVIKFRKGFDDYETFECFLEVLLED